MLSMECRTCSGEDSRVPSPRNSMALRKGCSRGQGSASTAHRRAIASHTLGGYGPIASHTLGGYGPIASHTLGGYGPIASHTLGRYSLIASHTLGGYGLIASAHCIACHCHAPHMCHTSHMYACRSPSPSYLPLSLWEAEEQRAKLEEAVQGVQEVAPAHSINQGSRRWPQHTA